MNIIDICDNFNFFGLYSNPNAFGLLTVVSLVLYSSFRSKLNNKKTRLGKCSRF